ncbi:release factor glutamine methyltransferase [Pancytospora epiphaga]|nr:release factor glutamine methyltransferase [Pancytospora epiphaga]
MKWYEPGEDTYTLIDAVKQECLTNKVIVDLGCSIGAITEVLESNNFVISCDLNIEALQELVRIGRKERVRNIIRTDLISGINQDMVDVIIFNPPYVPDFDCPILGGGPDGRVIIDRFINTVAVPVFYLLVIEANKPKEIIKEIELRRYKTTILRIRQIIGETVIIIKGERVEQVL